jgi:hypothetical protein
VQLTCFSWPIDLGEADFCLVLEPKQLQWLCSLIINNVKKNDECTAEREREREREKEGGGAA